jgi:hypothetical protein
LAFALAIGTQDHPIAVEVKRAFVVGGSRFELFTVEFRIDEVVAVLVLRSSKAMATDFSPMPRNSPTSITTASIFLSPLTACWGASKTISNSAQSYELDKEPGSDPLVQRPSWSANEMQRFLLIVWSTVSSTIICQAAEQVCDTRQAIVLALAQRYQETVQAIGLANDGALLEIFASDRGTWTAVMTDPRGRSCMIAAGEAYEQISRDPLVWS